MGVRAGRAEIAGGGLDRDELTFEAWVAGALEHVGLVSLLQENLIRFTIDPVEGQARAGRAGARHLHQRRAGRRPAQSGSVTR
jgi:hypothetical protein